MNKGDLQKLTGLSSSTIAKLSKNEVVKLDVVDRICETLKVPIYDVVRKYSGISIFQLDLMGGWKIEEDIAGTRHCLKVADCATDKTGDKLTRGRTGITKAAKAG